MLALTCNKTPRMPRVVVGSLVLGNVVDGLVVVGGGAGVVEGTVFP